MKEIANWNGIKFTVDPSKIMSFTGLSVKSGIETEDKVAGGLKWVTKKNENATEITMTAELQAPLGVSVREEFERLDGKKGEVDYLYIGKKKLIPQKVMLTGATTDNISIASSADRWRSGKVKLTFKSASDKGGDKSGTAGGGGGYSAKVYYSGGSGAVQSTTGYSTISYNDAVKKAMQKVPKNAEWASTKQSQAKNDTPKSAAKQQAQKAASDAAAYIEAQNKSAKETSKVVITNRKENAQGSNP